MARHRRFELFTPLAFLPPASFALAWMYVQGFEGWGRWGAAPLLLVPVILSVPITLLGIRRLHAERTRGSIRTATFALTVVAALPSLWFVYRLVAT